jgi:arsenate reductase-like glutaredoxin family protein
MIITSGYRSQQINFLAGGALNSQHKEGKAADFIIKGMTPKEIVEIIKNSDIEFDQLINEYDKWVHISFNKGKNRKEVLKF